MVPFSFEINEILNVKRLDRSWKKFCTKPPLPGLIIQKDKKLEFDIEANNLKQNKKG